MQDARGSIEELRGTNQRLQSLIDMQRLAGAAVLENRNLYHKVCVCVCGRSCLRLCRSHLL